jgi:hypothetical protein
MLLGEPVEAVKVGYLKSIGLKFACDRFMVAEISAALISLEVGLDGKNDG